MAKKDGGGKVGRDSRSGQFVPAKRSNSHPKTTIVERVREGKPGDPPPNKKG